MIIEKRAPIKLTRVSEKYCPWINKDLKDKLEKEAVKLWSPTENSKQGE